MLDNLAYFDALGNHTTPSGGVTGLVVKCGIGTSRTDHSSRPKPETKSVRPVVMLFWWYSVIYLTE
jgi:hypothetical protein